MNKKKGFARLAPMAKKSLTGAKTQARPALATPGVMPGTPAPQANPMMAPKPMFGR